MSKIDDATRLRHMLETATLIQKFVKNKGFAALEKEKMLSHALMNLLSIIGEAASKISKPTQQQLPEIPWQTIVGMRNRLIHAYFSIDLKIVWDTVTQDIPKLIPKLEKALEINRLQERQKSQTESKVVKQQISALKKSKKSEIER